MAASQNRRRSNVGYQQREQIGFGYSGNRFCNADLVSPFKISWGDPGVPMTTSFKIMPALDPDTGKPLPWKEVAAPGDFTPWIKKYMAVRGGGSPGQTYILYDPADYADQQERDVIWQYPAKVLIGAVGKAAKANVGEPVWQSMIKGSQSSGAIIKQPQFMYLVLGSVIETKSEMVSVPSGLNGTKLSLIDLGSGLGNDIARESDRLREGEVYDENIDDIKTLRKMFEHGNIVSLKTGPIVRAWPGESPDPRVSKVATQERRSLATMKQKAAAHGSTQTSEKKGFNFYFDHECKMLADGIDFSGVQDELFAAIHPIEDCIKIATIEQQIEYLTRGTIDPTTGRPAMKLFEYAFADRDDWLAMIPEDVIKRAKGSVSVRGGYDPNRDDEDDDTDAEETPKHGYRGMSGESANSLTRGRRSRVAEDEEEDDETDTRSRRRGSRVEEDEDDDHDSKKLASRRRRATEEDDDEDDETPQPRNRARRAVEEEADEDATPRTRSRRAAVDEDEDDEDNRPVRGKVRQRVSEDGDDDDSDDEPVRPVRGRHVDEDDDEDATPRASRRRVAEPVEDDDEEVTPRASRRRVAEPVDDEDDEDVARPRRNAVTKPAGKGGKSTSKLPSASQFATPPAPRDEPAAARPKSSALEGLRKANLRNKGK